MKDCPLTDAEMADWEAKRKVAKARHELEKTLAKKMLEQIGYICGFDKNSGMLTVVLDETSMNDRTFPWIRQYLEERGVYVGLSAKLPEYSNMLDDVTGGKNGNKSKVF